MKKYENELDTYVNNRHKCTVCRRTIPKDVDRLNFSYRTQWGYSHIRLCSFCIEQLYLVLNKSPLEEWKQKIMVEEI